jgi:hypothetical protein
MMVEPLLLSKAKAKTGEMIRQMLAEMAGGKREITPADLGTPYAKEMYNDWLAAELIALSTWSVNPINDDPEHPLYMRIFDSAKQVLDPKKGGLYSDEITIMFTNYMLMELELGPREQVLFAGNDSVLNLWMERLKEGMWKLDPFSSLAWLDLAELCSAALQKLHSLVSSGSVVLDLPFSSLPSTSESSPTE